MAEIYVNMKIIVVQVRTLVYALVKCLDRIGIRDFFFVSTFCDYLGFLV